MDCINDNTKVDQKPFGFKPFNFPDT